LVVFVRDWLASSLSCAKAELVEAEYIKYSTIPEKIAHVVGQSAVVACEEYVETFVLR
jgi:hypothetical protein